MRLAGLVITCEHASRRVPREVAPLFRGEEALLASHRAWDPGALEVARALAKRFDAPLVAGEVTRLVVDLNRSVDHPRLHWGPVAALDEATREALVRRYHAPFRAEAVRHLERVLRRGAVLHVSVHSFTPVLDGKVRIAELGVLFDPARALEKRLASDVRDALAANDEGWRVRKNYPYAGWTDGMTTAMRRRFPPRRYAGIELEISQKLAGDRRALAKVARLFGDTLEPLLG